MDTQILEDIGLTNAEIKVYLALLEIGSCSAGLILDKTGLQNSVVHMTLNRLIEKGLISFVKEGKKHIYQAADPKHISQYIEDKKERFEKILPELLLKRGMSPEKPEVSVFRGKKGIRELLWELLEAGGMWHYTIGSPLESTMMGDAFWIDYHEKRAKKKISAKIIFNESLREWTKGIRGENHYPDSEVRFLGEGFEPLTETIVRNDKVGIILWTEKPIGILIHQKQIADSYEKYFAVVWDRAKE